MFALQNPNLPTVEAIPMAIGQTLIELVCHPPRDRPLPLAVMEQLAMGLDADFCIVAMGRRANEDRQVWFWSAADGSYQRLTSSSFWQNPWVKAIAASETVLDYPEDRLLDTPQTDPTRPLPTPLVCEAAIGLRTIFQGKVNGLVILGTDSPSTWQGRQSQWLVELQSSLGVVNHLLRTAAPPLKHCCKPASPVPHLVGDPPPSLPASKKMLEDSPIVRLWYDATRQQLEQQREWNEQLIHNIITIMSDQTRNPLATIRMGIEMLRKAPPTPDQLNRRLAIIEAEWRKLNDINEKILQLRNLKAEEDTVLLHRFDLIPVLQGMIDSQTQTDSAHGKDQRQIMTDFPDQICRVDANYAHLQQILKELLTNAQKFSPAGSAIAVKLEGVEISGQTMIQLQCSNRSVCVTQKQLKSFFDPFYREQWAIDSAIAGIGLGLTITQTLIEQLNGKINVACEPVTEADQCLITFTLWIPGRLAGK
ncbi:MAG: HAMP domain-containing sensor histidine kinase [Synechocystis sp.]|nr:HAMP domain-containing sensor histidine kinase [Synechocystis sp.]